MKKITLFFFASFLVFALGAQTISRAPITKNADLKATEIMKSNDDAKGAKSVSYIRESFESTTFPPTGWSKLNPDAGTGWTRVTVGTSPLPGWQGGTATAPANGGNAIAYCSWNTGGASSNDQWLVTPQLANIQATDVLTFWALRWPKTFLDKLEIKISTTDATSPASFSIMGLEVNFPANAGDSVWTMYSVPVGTLVPAGSNIYVGFREVVANNSADGASISLDLVSWGDLPATDAALTDVAVPAPACLLTNNESVEVTVTNAGSAAISDYQIFMQKGGAGTPVSTTITASLAPEATYTHTFTGVDLSAPGLDSIKAWVVITGDANTANDMSAWFYTYNVAPSSVPYSNSFETQMDILGWSTIDGNNDDATWFFGQSATLAHTGEGLAAINFNATEALNDWLISTCINIAPGDYALTYWYRVQEAQYAENLKVSFGTEASAAGLTNQIADHPGITNIVYAQGIAPFTIATTGTYYFGFHAYSDLDKYRIYLDDVAVVVDTKVEDIALSTKVYPNPATNNIRIESNSTINNVRIMNVLGQEVYKQVVANRGIEVNVSNLKSGVYFVTIETANGTKTQKINILK